MTLKFPMSDEQRERRFKRARRLHIAAEWLGIGAAICTSLGLIWWPSFVAAGFLLAAGIQACQAALSASPYR